MPDVGAAGAEEVRRHRVPSLYLIVSEEAVTGGSTNPGSGRPLLHVLPRVLSAAQRHRRSDGSLPVAICLREKFMLGSQLFSLARDLVAMTRAFGAPLFINGRLDVALAVDATGVHLPAQGISVADVRVAAPHLRVGLSTHTEEEVRRAGDAGADFVVFGPVFETPSKTGILPPRGLDQLARVTSATTLPVLALGGIGIDAVAACRSAGAAGVACIRAVLAAEDPAAATEAFLNCFPADLR